jgi:hypothetical protein
VRSQPASTMNNTLTSTQSKVTSQGQTFANYKATMGATGPVKREEVATRPTTGTGGMRPQSGVTRK